MVREICQEEFGNGPKLLLTVTNSWSQEPRGRRLWTVAIESRMNLLAENKVG